MSYHRALGQPVFTSTTAFAQAVDPYSMRFSPPGAVYAPYGWGPDFNVGMPMNYTHHLAYERVPVPGARRNLGPMMDRLGCAECHHRSMGDSGDGLGAIIVL